MKVIWLENKTLNEKKVFSNSKKIDIKMKTTCEFEFGWLKKTANKPKKGKLAGNGRTRRR